MPYEKISAEGYTRDQLNFKRQHTGQLVHAAPLRPLWPFALVAAIALGVGCQMIARGETQAIALFGLVACLVGLGLIWFIGSELAKKTEKEDHP